MDTIKKESKVKIVIPKANENEVTNISSGQFGDIKKKFEKVDQVISGILATLVALVVTVIIAVVGIFIDQVHHNYVAYKEYNLRLEEIQNNRSELKELTEENRSLRQEIEELEEKVNNL